MVRRCVVNIFIFRQRNQRLGKRRAVRPVDPPQAVDAMDRTAELIDRGRSRNRLTSINIDTNQLKSFGAFSPDKDRSRRLIDRFASSLLQRLGTNSPARLP